MVTWGYSLQLPQLSLQKNFTLANYVNFSHTYGQPIIHGKTESESIQDRQRLAQNIANAAQNKIIVTGLNDDIDIKTVYNVQIPNTYILV